MDHLLPDTPGHNSSYRPTTDAIPKPALFPFLGKPPIPDLREFTSRLDRIERYLNSTKLHFHDGVLELNPAPFLHAEEALPPHHPLAYITLFLRETCWSPDDLAGRTIVVQALRLWCQQKGGGAQ